MKMQVIRGTSEQWRIWRMMVRDRKNGNDKVQSKTQRKKTISESNAVCEKKRGREKDCGKMNNNINKLYNL